MFQREDAFTIHHERSLNLFTALKLDQSFLMSDPDEWEARADFYTVKERVAAVFFFFFAITPRWSRPLTTSLHRTRSCAILSTSDQLRPAVFISVSTVLHHAASLMDPAFLPLLELWKQVPPVPS